MRERFSKTSRLFNSESLGFGESLREIFLTFDVKDFRDEINFWLEISLANDRAPYPDAGDREDVIDFCGQLIKLVEAFYHISVYTGNLKNTGAAKKKFVENKVQMIPETQQALRRNERLSKPPFITQMDMETAEFTIKEFRLMFSASYAQVEILDLLDAMITYAGTKEVSRENLVLFYQCMCYLVASAYAFPNKPPINR
jgi:hypothetical protein